MNEQFKLTDEEINKIVLHSPYVLPSSPYKQGLGSGQIKKYFYDFIIYLCEKLNIHLQDLGQSIDTINEALVLINGKAEELHESDLQLYNSLMNEISRVKMENNQEKLDIEGEIEDVRLEVEAVRNLASGKSKTHSVPSLLNMMEYLYTDTDKVNVGDFILLADRDVPDFIVYSKTGSVPKSYEQISWEEIQRQIDQTGDFALEAKQGMAYLFIDRDVTVIAIEGVGKVFNRSTSYNTYDNMIQDLNNLSRDTFKTGDNVYIREFNVPDLWVSDVSDIKAYYEYEGDLFLSQLESEGSVQVGYFWLSALETKRDDLPTDTSASKKWEQIVKLVVGEGELKDVSEEGISIIDIAKDEDGLPFEITDFQGIIVYNDAGAFEEKSVDFTMYIRNSNNNYNRGICKHTITNFSNGGRKWYFKYIYFGENQGGMFLCTSDFCASTSQYPSVNATYNKVVYVPANVLYESNYYYNLFKAIVINASVPLKRGDTVTIWGVRK